MISRDLSGLAFFHKASPNSLQKKPLGKNIRIVKVEDVKSLQGTNLSGISFRYYIIHWHERSLISPLCTRLYVFVFLTMRSTACTAAWLWEHVEAVLL